MKRAYQDCDETGEDCVLGKKAQEIVARNASSVPKLNENQRAVRDWIKPGNSTAERTSAENKLFGESTPGFNHD